MNRMVDCLQVHLKYGMMFLLPKYLQIQSIYYQIQDKYDNSERNNKS